MYVCVSNDLTRPEKGNFDFWQYPRRQTGRRRSGGTDLATAQLLRPSQSVVTDFAGLRTRQIRMTVPARADIASFFSFLFKLL